MSEYESETPEQLLIRQQRGQASNVSLTSPNVRRVYNDFRQTRPPTGRSMASHSGHEDYVGAMLNALYPTSSAATMTGAVGVGSSLPVTVPAGTAAVGVRTVPPSSTVPSTSGVRTSAVPSTSGTRTTSRGKEPRAVRRSRSRSRSGTPSSDEQRRRATREEARRRFDRILRERRGAGGGGDDGDGGGDGGGGGGGGGSSDGGGSDGRRSRRGRRRRGGMHDNLDDLLEALRRRTGGRHIAGITHTDTITTTYKDGRPPTVDRISSRASGSEPL